MAPSQTNNDDITCSYLLYTSSSCPGFPGKYRETGNTGQDLLVFNIIRSHKYFPFPRISRDFPGFPVISPGFPRFPEISRDFPGLPKIFRDFPRFPGISRDFPEFPEISRDFPRFSEISRFPGFPVSREFPFPGIPSGIQTWPIVCCFEKKGAKCACMVLVNLCSVLQGKVSVTTVI